MSAHILFWIKNKIIVYPCRRQFYYTSRFLRVNFVLFASFPDHSSLLLDSMRFKGLK